MRTIILAVALVALAPAAFAQYRSVGDAPGPIDDTATPPRLQTPPMPPSEATGTDAILDPNNCGTPDEPKVCPPMPRHALKDYPPNR